MTLPRQSPPVKRPDVVEPCTTVNVVNGKLDYMIRIRMELTHGANYNDPAHFSMLSAGERIARR